MLQTIVDKVFPHFMKEDLLLEHAFWKDLGMEPPYELLPLPKEGEEEEDKKPSMPAGSHAILCCSGRSLIAIG